MGSRTTRAACSDLDAAGRIGGQEALLFLANYCKDAGALQEAQQYCSRLLDFGGHEKEEAKALLRDIRSQFSQAPQ